MIVKIDKSFAKDTDTIKDKKILAKIAECIEHVQSSTSPLQVKNLKKLKGFTHHYRIRIGDYRAGIIVLNNTVYFERFLHRRDIYKYYP